MKITISTKHTYLSGWTAYDMTWKTEYTGFRNKTIQSIVVVSKEPFSAKGLKKWASELGYDLETLFTDIENCKSDVAKINEFTKIFNNKYLKNIDEINSQDKCMIKYSATLNNHYTPLKTAFETIEAYDVYVLIEYKSGVIKISFPSQGRKKSESCTMLVFDGGKLKSLYGEEEAISKIRSRIQNLIDDCDSDEKFKVLPRKLNDIRTSIMKSFR